MTVEIVFLGTGTAIPDPQRGPAGLLLIAGDALLVFDSGPGTWQRLARAGFDFREIDAILYSHLHLDHILDYPAYLFAARNPEYSRKTDLEVWAPRGFLRYDRALKETFGDWVEPPDINVNVHALEPKKSQWEFKGVSITAAPVEHSDESMAFRADFSGKSFVYGGDLDYCEEIIDLARGADLLVIESAFPESRPHPGHLTPSAAGKIAREAGVEKLALTHFYPDCEGEDMAGPAKAEFGGQVILAEDLMRIKF